MTVTSIRFTSLKRRSETTRRRVDLATFRYLSATNLRLQLDSPESRSETHGLQHNPYTMFW
ncbi:hypothetical protein Hanom_Chr07g00602841 [Helianthus anomalus]